jgi:hypothetical protein
VRNEVIKTVLLVVIGFGTSAVFPMSGPVEDCDKANEQVTQLTAVDGALLQSKGILYRSGTWFFSAALLPDCTVRLRMPQYFNHVINEHATDADRQFARAHQAELSSVLLATFPLLARSDAVPSDGDFRDAVWGLLRESELPNADLANILRRELQLGDGFSEAMTHFLLLHPVPELAPDLQTVVAENQTVAKGSSVATAVYALAALSRLASDTTPIRLALGRLEEDPRATKAERKVIPKLIAKLSAGEGLKWSDLEDIALQNID